MICPLNRGCLRFRESVVSMCLLCYVVHLRSGPTMHEYMVSAIEGIYTACVMSACKVLWSLILYGLPSMLIYCTLLVIDKEQF